MLYSRKLLQSSSNLWPCESTHLNGIYAKTAHQIGYTYAAFCNRSVLLNVAETASNVESPELPNWVKFCEKADPSLAESDDDDFELPKLSGWADTQKLFEGHSKQVKCVVGEIVDSDVRLTELLKCHFDSLDAVCQALAVCDGIELSESLVERILLRFYNYWIPAFGFFKWVNHQNGSVHSENCYNMMVDILGKARKFELMWELVEGMDKLAGFVSTSTMTKVMRRLSKARKYVDAIEAFKKFERFGLIKETSAMNILMDALVKEGSVEHAEGMLLEYKDTLPPNSHTFNFLIHGWCKARKYNEARKVMEQMKKHGCYPDVASYTPFVEYYCHEKNFRKVYEILDEMQQQGCLPNVVTFTIVMHALGKAKDINGSLEAWEKMKRSGCVPDANVYSALIFTLSKSGRFQDACDLFKDMPEQNVPPTVLAYNTMISAACMHSKEEFALELLQEMEQKSCRPVLKTYSPLLKMCCQKKRMKVLNYLLSDMYRKNISIDLGTYSLLVNGLCRNGKLEHACSFFEQMVLKGMVPKYSIYKLLMEKLEEKSMQKAKQLVENLMPKLLYHSETSSITQNGQKYS